MSCRLPSSAYCTISILLLLLLLAQSCTRQYMQVYTSQRNDNTIIARQAVWLRVNNSFNQLYARFNTRIYIIQISASTIIFVYIVYMYIWYMHALFFLLHLWPYTVYFNFNFFFITVRFLSFRSLPTPRPGLLFPRRLILHDSHWLIKRHRRWTKQNVAQLKRAMYTNKTGGSYLSVARYASTRLVPGCPWCRVRKGENIKKKDHVNKK